MRQISDTAYEMVINALKFYAEGDHYWKGPNGSVEERDTVIEIDGGKTAREALLAARGEAGAGEKGIL